VNPSATAPTELEAFIRAWVRSLAEQDVQSAASLRTEDYRLTVSDGAELDKAQELAYLASPALQLGSVTLEAFSGRAEGARAEAIAEVRVVGKDADGAIDRCHRLRFRCRMTSRGWQAEHVAVEELEDRALSSAPLPRPAMLRRLLAPFARSLRGLRTAPRASFQELSYIPFEPGADYVLPPFPAPTGEDSALPVPPQSLWLGYEYAAHGEAHVRAMLDIVGKSGLTLEAGDRILDLGCGAGRMIRHLRPFADRCEIWGTDISAPHIYWCREHLSPPFHFATTTKVPHLPFEDGSFELIYCGSLFTHIDDLADAWLLELHRILAPGRGRLYVTLHDEHTMKLFEQPQHRRARVVREITSASTFREAKEREFGMFTIGRDDRSQVFYRRDYFERLAANAFDLLSVTEEAYFYQSAYLMARKSPPPPLGASNR
jgi:ubiquinone/menaquinone biosynthesis C-methylase UbiE